MLMNGRRDLADIGAYRTHADPMQIVSGTLHAPRVHFEAPPSDRVPEEMTRFIAWFNESSPQGGAPVPAVTRAAIAHLRSEEHTSELQSLMRSSYAVFCLKKKKTRQTLRMKHKQS